MLLLDYQSGNIENYFVLFTIYSVRFSKFPDFDRAFLSVDVGDFLQKAAFENLQKQVKIMSKISLFSFPTMMTLTCIHVGCLPGRIDSPRINHSYQGKDFHAVAGLQCIFMLRALSFCSVICSLVYCKFCLNVWKQFSFTQEDRTC